MTTRIIEFLSDENGATSIEYSLVAALVFLAIFGAVDVLGLSVNTAMSSVNSDLETVAAGIR